MRLTQILAEIFQWRDDTNTKQKQWHKYKGKIKSTPLVNIVIIRLLSVITSTPSSKNNVSLINTGPSFRH